MKIKTVFFITLILASVAMFFFVRYKHMQEIDERQTQYKLDSSYNASINERIKLLEQKAIDLTRLGYNKESDKVTEEINTERAKLRVLKK